MLADVFKHANKEYDSEENCEDAKDNPDSQLLRHEFFVSLTKISYLPEYLC